MVDNNAGGLIRIISGGQTGVDRAALDVAIARGMEHGGWCPRGRRAEDGKIDRAYRLKETNTAVYAERTKRNVLEADGTLILCRGRPSGGTELTVQLAEAHDRPCRVVDLDQPHDLAEVRQWLRSSRIAVLNVAGPRESTSPGIYDEAARYLSKLFDGT